MEVKWPRKIDAKPTKARAPLAEIVREHRTINRLVESAKHRPAKGQIINGDIVEFTTNRPSDGVQVGPWKVAVWANEEAASAVVASPGEGKSRSK